MRRKTKHNKEQSMLSAVPNSNRGDSARSSANKQSNIASDVEITAQKNDVSESWDGITGGYFCRSINRKSRERVDNWLFLVPCLLVLALCAGWPLLKTIYFSFTDATLDNLREFSFIGIDNFIDLAKDQDWWTAVFNTLIITIIAVPLETVLGMVIALILHRNFKGRGWMRAIVLIPWTIPTIVSARMWAWMLNDVYGIVNELLIRFGIIDNPIPWIASNMLSIVSIILVDVWKTTPYMALLLLAGLQSLPQDCFEAAEVDSIPFRKTFFRIIIPLMKPTIIVAMIFRGLETIKIFDLVYILSSGSSATATMSVFARKHLVDYADVGFGSAAATALLFLIAFLSIFYISFNRRKLYKLNHTRAKHPV